MEGFIFLHRQLLDSEIFCSEKGLKIWIWLLLKARHKKGFVSLSVGAGQQTIELGRGQLLFGRFTAEEALGINGSTIYKWIKKFEALKMIELKSNSHSTTITIMNFNKFNDFSTLKVTGKRQQSSNRVAAEEQHGNTNNNDNNDYIIDYLNKKVGSNYKTTSKKTQSLINARLNEGFTIEDFKKVIDNKYSDWASDEKMSVYLRPETLFSPKFESYLNQKKAKEVPTNSMPTIAQRIKAQNELYGK